MTAHRAFQFCKQYKRTTEFRRLCEIIRNHLANLNKYRDQRDRPDLSAPESLQLYLDTRVEQLKIATELELWQVGISDFYLRIYYMLVFLMLKALRIFGQQPNNFFLGAGSLQISGGYTWTDVLGQENSQAIFDGCLLCEAD